MLIAAGILDGGCCPNESHQPLGYHSSVKDATAHTLTLETTCHHGALSAVETTDGTTGYRDAQHGKHGQPLGMMARERVGEFGHPAVMGEDAYCQPHCHDEHSQSEEGIDAADECTHRQQSGQYIIEEDECRPEEDSAASAPTRRHVAEQIGRCGHKHSRHQHQKHHGEHAHEEPDARPQFIAHKLGNGYTTLAQADHPAHVVMCSTRKDTAKHYPQVGCRTKQNAHDGTEDGASAGNVEKLDEEHFPSGHGDIIHSILLGKTGCGPVWLHSEHSLHHCTVEHISKHKGNKRNTKRNHVCFFFL